MKIIRSPCCIQIPSIGQLVAWAQFGGGHGDVSPPLFQMGGHNMLCPPTFYFLAFVFREISKIKVLFVTFYVKRFSC